MRRITVWAMSTLSSLVLLFSYHTSTDASAASSVVATDTEDTSGTPTPTPSTASESESESATATPTPSAATATPQATESAATPADTSSTFTGDAINTKYGPVQVQITVVGGQVTESVVTQVPWNDRKDQEINSRAVPILNAEAVSAQSADIDMVSGATYTSQAYIASLQAALDQANL